MSKATVADSNLLSISVYKQRGGGGALIKQKKKSVER